jgi:hypothetical protein
MNSVQIGQKSYEMPPRDGFTVAYFLTVAGIDRSARMLPGPNRPLGGRPTRFPTRTGKGETQESTKDNQGLWPSQ